MIVVPFYWANSIDNGIDVLVCKTQDQAITKLIEVMKEFNTGRRDETSHDRLLDTALNYIKQSKLNEAFQCLDTWIEAYNNDSRVFAYIIKEQFNE